MDTNTGERLNIILAQAGRDVKGNYQIYHSYKRMLEDLNLSPKDYERAVRKLSAVLKV